MSNDSKLLDMLVGYASAHQHPANIAVHLVGIPVIMLGVFIPLTWLSIEIVEFQTQPGSDHPDRNVRFLRMSLDWIFALAFLAFGAAVAVLAAKLGSYPQSTALTIAAAAFFGGYAAQFIGHAIEKSMPVLLKTSHPGKSRSAVLHDR